MELVPIIYTALIIFAVLAITTILISYVLFKVKGKDDSDYEEEKDSKPELIKPVKVNVKHESPPKKKSLSQNKTSLRPKDKKRPTPSKRKVKPDPIKNNKRIRILNPITPPTKGHTKPTENKEPAKPKTAYAAGDSEYSNDDSEFFRLDTSGKKK